jgi:hypothetical protein
LPGRPVLEELDRVDDRSALIGVLAVHARDRGPRPRRRELVGRRAS